MRVDFKGFMIIAAHMSHCTLSVTRLMQPGFCVNAQLLDVESPSLHVESKCLRRDTVDPHGAEGVMFELRDGLEC